MIPSETADNYVNVELIKLAKQSDQLRVSKERTSGLQSGQGKSRFITRFKKTSIELYAIILECQFLGFQL
ncbi:hypothetical protein RN001_004807 [Aquatica leii]|uniref:Uncharacterized protein n=1 Tax=Aquatica leii TaxID=1421715 RepID=A0AAN7SPN5_9COLE|nr:hypothetical protein RN001_004807 [Aquatica leii]